MLCIFLPHSNEVLLRSSLWSRLPFCDEASRGCTPNMETKMMRSTWNWPTDLQNGIHHFAQKLFSATWQEHEKKIEQSPTNSKKTWKDKIRIDSSCSCHVPVIIWQEGDLGRVSCLSDTDTVAMKGWGQGQSLEKTRVWHVTKYVWICIALSQLSQLSRDMSWSKVPALVTYHSLGILAAFSGDFGRSKCFLCAREDAKWSSSLDSYQDSQDSQDSIWFAYLGNDSKDSCLGSSFWQFLCHLDYMWTI